jgi:predicted ATP-grasp superfamily ATP-dependent carboligase
MTETPAAVLLGGSTNALSVARGLGAGGVPVHAVGDANAVVRHSRHCTRFYPLGDGDVQAGYRRLLKDSVPRPSVVIPCDDDALELIARSRGEIGEWGLLTVPADDRVVLDLLDKNRTYEIARRAGVGAPRTIPLHGPEDLEPAVAEIGLPCALKPLHIHEFSRIFMRKVFLIRDVETLRRAFAQTSEHGLEMLLTEIVPGREDRYWSYYTYIDESGGPLTHFTKRKLRQYPIGFGGATYHVATWDADVASAGLRFVTEAGVRGVACVEFKRDPRDEVPRIIECNARVTAANELMRLAGVDLGVISYRDALALPVVSNGSFKQNVRLWYPIQDTLAFMEARAEGDLTFATWIASLAHRQRFPTLSLSDPVPGLAEAARLPRRVYASRRRNAAGGVHSSRPGAPL